MELTKTKALFLSGLSWIGIGLFLLYKGLFILNATMRAGPPALTQFVKGFAGSLDRALVSMMVVALFVGYLKSRLVLRKTVKRVSERILSLEGELNYRRMYPMSYVALLFGMMLLGMSLRFMPIPRDIHGLVDVAIGAGVINAGMLFFLYATKESPAHKTGDR